jgi:hypothetical protein
MNNYYTSDWVTVPYENVDYLNHDEKVVVMKTGIKIYMDSQYYHYYWDFKRKYEAWLDR